ncbi:PhaM family polyhydroxyalkanoate granule multifunctional regulatory protein [Uliginosibacterium sp. sgz301328]|uniref:PhaM family polyhydroxyalkanoate granule multifunctional regulatory protein n=1 Tax=Uliginosibacterium sp. sgz301328 TaxID=3243764 RepID=UPI00359D6FC6
MTGTTPSPDEGREFLRKMWGNMGFGMPGMVTPTLDVDELDRRVNDLKAVEGWLRMNLGMLQMTIQGLEVQRATLQAVRAMGQAHEAAGNDPASNPFANPALWAWPFSPSPAADESDNAQEPEPPPTKNRSSRSRSK